MPTQQLVQFIMNHWALVAILVVLVIALIYIEVQTKIIGARGIDSKVLINLMNASEAVVIDLRDQETFLNGHILGSINIPMQNFTTDLDASVKRLNDHKNKKLVFVDLGAANAKVYSLLKELQKKGVSNMEVLNSGIGAWKEAGLPLTKH